MTEKKNRLKNIEPDSKSKHKPLKDEILKHETRLAFLPIIPRTDSETREIHGGLSQAKCCFPRDSGLDIVCEGEKEAHGQASSRLVLDVEIHCTWNHVSAFPLCTLLSLSTVMILARVVFPFGLL